MYVDIALLIKSFILLRKLVRQGITQNYDFLHSNMFLLLFSVLAVQSKGMFLIVTFVVIGFLRGATLVNLNLSISECCSLKKLPSALGMFMVSKGLFVVTMSPLIGTS